MTRLGTTTSAILTVLSLSAAAGSQGESQERPANSIRQWVEDLDSDQFIVRQAATWKLIDAGSKSITPMAEAATRGNLEVRSRASYILRKIADSGDRQAEQAVIAALERVAESADEAAGRQAARLLTEWTKWKVARQQQAIAQIRRLGGTVSTLSADTMTVKIGSNWKGGEAGLAHLRNISNLRRLSLEHSTLGDNALAQLKGLTQVNTLYLGETEIRGSGLVHLKGLRGLTYLSLKDLKVDDNAVKPIGEMTQLTHLGLDGTTVTDAALSHLKNLTKLEVLWLNRSDVTDAGLAYYWGRSSSLNGST